MSVKTCSHETCNVAIIPSWEMCKRHHGEVMKQKRLARKMAVKKRAKSKPKGKKSGQGLIGADGKVRANMGLARLKERDRQAWLAKQAKEFQEMRDQDCQ